MTYSTICYFSGFQFTCLPPHLERRLQLIHHVPNMNETGWKMRPQWCKHTHTLMYKVSNEPQKRVLGIRIGGHFTHLGLGSAVRVTAVSIFFWKFA